MKKYFYLFLLLLSAPLFFYNLGATSLVDFDEAWYADIARNIIITKNPLLLAFNGNPYFDHPPLGFLLIALSFIVFGISEFSARLPSAICGFITPFILYLTGKKLFNGKIGLAASLVVLSTVWFIFRARSGNLDSVFLFFYLLSFYLGIKIKDNSGFIYPASVSLGALLLTKSIIGVTVVLAVVIYLYLHQVKIPLQRIFWAAIIVITLITPWYLANFIQFGNLFLERNISIGLKTSTRLLPDLTKITQLRIWEYLRFSLWKWFKPLVIALPVAMFFIKKQINLLPVYSIIIVLLAGFVSNSATEIWHLILLYPFFALILAYFVHELFYTFLMLFKLFKLPYVKLGFNLLYILIFTLLSVWQIYHFLPYVKFFDQGISDLAYVSISAKNRPEKLYTDSDDLFPSSVFYSGKNISLIRYQDKSINLLKTFITSGPRPTLVLTEQWKIDVNNIPPTVYEVLAERNNYLLIRLP